MSESHIIPGNLELNRQMLLLLSKERRYKELPNPVCFWKELCYSCPVSLDGNCGLANSATQEAREKTINFILYNNVRKEIKEI